MHAPGHRWTTLTLVVIVASTIGCRGSRPFSRFVQVTQRETDADLPEIDPPRQRLATTKPRDDGRNLTPDRQRMTAEADPAATQARRPDGSPHVTRNTSTSGSAARSNPASPIRESIADRRPSAPRGTSTIDSGESKSKPSASVAHKSEPTGSRTTGAEGSASQQQVVAKSASTTKSVATATTASSRVGNPVDMHPSELREAFSNYPPEVQREALRRLVAATSRSADRTTQPNALDAELAKNVIDLPDLPEAKNTTPATPPKRIATDEPNPTSAVASITAAVDPSASSEQETPHGSVTDLVTTDLESNVRTISDTVEGDTSEVKPASASRDHSDEPMIAQAAGNPGGSTKASDAASQSDQLSDEALFASLLKRLSTPAPDESEAERSSRLIRRRHLMVLAGDPDAAVEQIEGMSKAEQEYLRHQLLGLWTMIDPQGHPVASRRFTTALPQIREAAKFAAAATDSLEVRSLAFCTEIESYGQIKTFKGNRFDAGQQVILYCEIENFTVDKTDEGFKTHLQGSYDIYDADNEKVVSQLLPADEQVSANYLRDYFIAYQMHLPQQLSAGTYRLQLTMEDVNGKKYGQASIPLEIAK